MFALIAAMAAAAQNPAPAADYRDDLDYLSEVNAILLSADYMAKQFPADAERCAGEAADKGRKLQEIGQALSGAGQAAAGHQH